MLLEHFDTWSLTEWTDTHREMLMSQTQKTKNLALFYSFSLQLTQRNGRKCFWSREINRSEWFWFLTTTNRKSLFPCLQFEFRFACAVISSHCSLHSSYFVSVLFHFYLSDHSIQGNSATKHISEIRKCQHFWKWRISSKWRKRFTLAPWKELTDRKGVTRFLFSPSLQVFLPARCNQSGGIERKTTMIKYRKKKPTANREREQEKLQWYACK